MFANFSLPEIFDFAIHAWQCLLWRLNHVIFVKKSFFFFETSINFYVIDYLHIIFLYLVIFLFCIDIWIVALCIYGFMYCRTTRKGAVIAMFCFSNHGIKVIDKRSKWSMKHTIYYIQWLSVVSTLHTLVYGVFYCACFILINEKCLWVPTRRKKT